MELSRIVPDPDQPRKEFTQEAIDRLSASLVKHGQLMPIRVRWNPAISKWVVISGERRYRAALQAGLKSVACIFAEDGLTTSEILQEQIIENLLREDLKPIEQAKAYRQLMDLHGWSAKELAGELQVSQGAISKSLSLLHLPEAIQAQVDAGAIPATTAYEVAKVPDPDKQRDVARRIVEEKLTREAATEVVREAVAKPPQVRTPRAKPEPTSGHESLAPSPSRQAVESLPPAVPEVASTAHTPTAHPSMPLPGGIVRVLSTSTATITITTNGNPTTDAEIVTILDEALGSLRNSLPWSPPDLR